MDYFLSDRFTLFSRNYLYLILAILAAISTFLFIQSDLYNFYPLTIKINHEKAVSRKEAFYYDLDGDGKSELFRFTKYAKNDVIEYFNSNSGIIDVIRTRGEFFKSHLSFIFGDSDKDGFKEFYFFIFRNDSIFLNAYELLGDDGHFLNEIFIDRCNTSDFINNYILLNPYLVDLEGNGYEELVFFIRAGYSLWPRTVYSYEIATHILHKSVNSAAAYSGITTGSSSGIGEKVIITTCNAIENFDSADDVLFNDHSGWLIVYNSSLDDTVFVKEFSENKSYVNATIMETGEGSRIFALIYEYKIGRFYLERYNFLGELEKRVFVSNGMENFSLINKAINIPGFIALAANDTIYKYDADLEIFETESSSGNLKTSFYEGFRIGTVLENYLFFGRDDELILRDNSLHILGKVKVAGFSNQRYFYNSVKNSRSLTDFDFCLNQNNDRIQFQVRKNDLYKFRVFIASLIFLIFYLIFYLIFRVQNYFYNRRYLTQNKIAALQLQTVQNQLQPHFTFNVLNTIGSMIYKNDKEKAYEYLNYFSDMLRGTLLSRSSPDWLIGEELNFISTYISMENLRFDKRFSYHLNIIDDEVLNKLIPKLMIQSLVENAIRHGLMHKDGECDLWLSLDLSEHHIVIEIKDNGIGRKASEKIQRQQIGVGNAILMEYIQVYNKNNKTKFIFTINDLTGEDGSVAGTEVIISIPKDFRSINPTL